MTYLRLPVRPRLRASRLAAAGLAALLTLTACTSGGSSGGGPAPASDSGKPSAEDTSTGSATPTSDPGPQAEIRPLTKRQWSRMQAAGMVRPECPIQSPDQLRVVAINHYDFTGRIRRGTLVVNADTAASVERIFTRLYQARFQIRQMRPVEAYDGDTAASLRANNTSAFNCRRPDQINAPFAESPHANGRAIDINPLQNPWMDLRCDCWVPSARYRARVPRPGGINRGGLVWRTFREEGWIWQNIDVADYMHFDTGYPSAPLGT